MSQAKLDLIKKILDEENGDSDIIRLNKIANIVNGTNAGYPRYRVGDYVLKDGRRHTIQVVGETGLITDKGEYIHYKEVEK